MFAHKSVPCRPSQCALARMAKTLSFHNIYTNRNTGKSEGGALHVEVNDDVHRKRRADGGSHVTVVRSGTGVFKCVLVDSGLGTMSKDFIFVHHRCPVMVRLSNVRGSEC
jgi:hypothetical protein